MQWFHCNADDGSIYTGGYAPDEATALMQAAPEGKVLVVVPDGSVGNAVSATPDFTALREHYHAQLDRQAGALRTRFITDVPGQAQTYEKKEAEARLWSEGDELTHPEKYPFMIAEATVRAVSVAQVQSEIMVQVGQLTPLAALIEAHRRAAKEAVTAATTLPEIAAAAAVDWEALIP